MCRSHASAYIPERRPVRDRHRCSVVQQPALTNIRATKTPVPAVLATLAMVSRLSVGLLRWILSGIDDVQDGGDSGIQHILALFRVLVFYLSGRAFPVDRECVKMSAGCLRVIDRGLGESCPNPNPRLWVGVGLGKRGCPERWVSCVI